MGDYDNHAAEIDRSAEEDDSELISIMTTLFSTIIEMHSSILLSLPSIKTELIPAALEYINPHFSAVQRRFSLTILVNLLESSIVPCQDVGFKQSFFSEFSPLLKVCLDPADLELCKVAVEASYIMAIHVPAIVDDELKLKLLSIVNQAPESSSKMFQIVQREASSALKESGLHSL